MKRVSLWEWPFPKVTCCVKTTVAMAGIVCWVRVQKEGLGVICKTFNVTAEYLDDFDVWMRSLNSITGHIYLSQGLRMNSYYQCKGGQWEREWERSMETQLLQEEECCKK